MTVKTVDAAEFSDLLKTADWLVVNFIQEHCGWCRAMEEPLARLEAIIGDKAPVVRLDKAVTPELFERFAVKGTPVSLLFKKGALKEIASGGGADTLDWLMSLEELAGA